MTTQTLSDISTLKVDTKIFNHNNHFVGTIIRGFYKGHIEMENEFDGEVKIIYQDDMDSNVYHSNWVIKEQFDIRKHFEANMLDGDSIDDCGGASFGARAIVEYIEELIEDNKHNF